MVSSLLVEIRITNSWRSFILSWITKIYFRKVFMFKKRILLVMATIVFFVFSGIVLLQRCNPKETKATSLQTGINEFVGDQSCKSCHAGEYKDWLKSHHFMAMQPVSDTTVAGDFNNRVFKADGVTS